MLHAVPDVAYITKRIVLLAFLCGPLGAAEPQWPRPSSKTGDLPFTIFATPWSPPAWMKTNKDRNHGGSLRTDMHQAYADFLSRYLREYKSRFGVTIDYVSVQNEPEISQSYVSCVWTGDQLNAFIKNYLAPTFIRDRVTAKVIMPESGWFADERYTLPALNDAASCRNVDVVAYHWYCGTYGPSASKRKGKKLWETEVWGPNSGALDASITGGVHCAKDIFNHITKANVNAYNYWWLVSDIKDNSALIICDNKWTTYTATKRLYTLGNYSRFVRPGWRRIGATENPASNVDVTAYKNPATGDFAIVAINEGSSNQDISFNLSGFTAPSVIPYRTSSTEDLALLSGIDALRGTFTATLAARSVTTFIGVAKR